MAKRVKNKTRAQKPKFGTNETLLVNTTSGNTLLRSDSKVLVHVGGDTYFEKPASQLQEGDMVLYEIEFTTKDYDPSLLLDDANFRKARDDIYVTDGEKHVPLLRDLLLRGLDHNSPIHIPDLEERIFMDPNEDFSREDYRKMEQHVHSLMVDLALSDEEVRSTSAINKWLKGETLAPSEWDIFSILSVLHPDFLDIHRSFGQSSGVHASYLVYTITSRAVARYFAQPKEPISLEPGQSSDYTRRGLVNIKPIVEHILKNHFGDCIDTKFRPSKVRCVEPVKQTGRNKGHQNTPDPKLKRGIYIVDDNQPNIHKVNLRGLFEDYLVIEKAILDTISSYLDTRFNVGEVFAPGLMNHNVTHKVMYHLIPHDNANEHWYKKNVPAVRDEQLANNYAQQVADAITTGRIDLELGLVRFDLMNAIKVYNNLSRQIPNGFKAWWIYRSKKNNIMFHGGTEDKQLTAQVRRLYETHVKPHSILEGYLGITDVSVSVTGSVGFRGEVQKRIMEQIRSNSTQLTSEKTDEILSRYDIQQFKKYVNLVPNRTIMQLS
ncbi:MAG: hypothetical protein ABIH82_04340 [Candidatus Woesearchaeota archaeon]